MVMMMIYKKGNKLIRELVKDWANGEINSNAAMIALSMIVNPKKPSMEATEWAIKMIKKAERI